MTPERAAELYRTADTLPLMTELLEARGLPELGQYAALVLRNTTPENRPWWAREKAALLENRVIPGCLAFQEKAPADVAKALRWIAEVCERGLPQMRVDWLKREECLAAPAATRCPTCNAPLRPGVDCCVPPVKKPRKRRSRGST